MAPKLGYWSIRGLAQPIRLLMAYAEAEVDEKRYNYGPPPNYALDEWMKEKYTFGLAFPNLPYYIDGDVKITQSLAIMRYLARKFKLDGEDEKEKLRIDMLEQQITDFKAGFARLCYNPEFDNLKDDYKKTLPDTLHFYAEFLGDNKWFAGDNLTYVDFLVYEAFDVHRILDPDCLKELPKLRDFLDRFEKLPTIERYMKTTEYLKWPLNGDMAKFGSRYTKP